MCSLMLSAIIICLPWSELSAQSSSTQKYQTPPKAIADLIDAPPTPYVSIDPTQKWMLIQEYPNLIAIEELAQPELRLAGIRMNPKNRGPSRGRYVTGLKLLDIKDGKEFEIRGLPEKAKIRNIRWSPDGNHIAFINSRENGQDLWVIDVSAKTAKKLVADKINSAYRSAFEWLPDNQTIICKIMPDDIGKAPVESGVPSAPVIQETSGKKAPARTYQDLLKNAHDEKLFEHHFTVQIFRVMIDGKGKQIGKTGIIRRIEPSPNGLYILVETVHRPFSYLVPAYRFPHSVEVWDLEGNVVKQIADLPLAEEVPIGFGAVPTGPRSFEWLSNEPAALCWVEAQDGGDPKAEAEIRDNIYTLNDPFSGEPRLLVSLQLRYYNVLWGNEQLAIVNEWWWRDRRIRSWKINPSSEKPDTTLLHDFSWQDRYNHPGYPLMRELPNGHSVLLTSEQGNTIYLVGDGASPEGDRPFIDSYDLMRKETKRLWRSEAPYFERPVELLDTDKLIMITRRESISKPPNYFIRDLKNEQLSQITKFPHPTPQLKDVQKELIRYEREDGVKMTATLYLPPNYKTDDGPLPMLMWAYPQEFKSADAAGQVTDSPYRFVRIGWWSPLLWLVSGYGVLDDPTMPIIGEGDEEPNDTYVEQLVASAKAAVEEMVRRGVAERNRIAIGGHSYGAFMTANLLAHSDLFSAGIARSGAYNRTLTPFGFQAEERTLWEALDVYFEMSPFMHADSVNEPILLIHGEADNNSGTFPMQSERFYNAIKGHGGTAKLVMLPLESHGYRSRESIMHMLWEMTNWLDKYVKNAE
ncbi:MAG: prolyl oligopeptidase family serine peptidase [Candidatus Latescibacteria bacterium]|nr:prolyl oligopeptidase family serine peptidase [Candidatus Latescibacterota bacterium]NIO55257.1 prolyl oligopeptidase family serine peptidase [Candidatus Latescibacterota bacterium]